MRYVSTRGRAPELGFADVLLAGLAPDGGLYVPSEYPALADLGVAPDYASAAAAVMAPFVGDVEAEQVLRLGLVDGADRGAGERAERGVHSRRQVDGGVDHVAEHGRSRRQPARAAAVEHQ